MQKGFQSQQKMSVVSSNQPGCCEAMLLCGCVFLMHTCGLSLNMCVSGCVDFGHIIVGFHAQVCLISCGLLLQICVFVFLFWCFVTPHPLWLFLKFGNGGLLVTQTSRCSIPTEDSKTKSSLKETTQNALQMLKLVVLWRNEDA